MQGQWLGEISENELVGSLRVELEARGNAFFGHAYVFCDQSLRLPGLRFELRVPRVPPHKIEAETLYLYSAGGVMTHDDRLRADQDISERFEGKIPPKLTLEFAMDGDQLRINWSSFDDESGSELLTKSDIVGKSELIGRTDLRTWDQFREWAVHQRPRQYIFRGQTNPSKLASSFHRTWRNDLATWIENDVRALFGAVIERVNYPLQLGQLDHNAAIWSILQHHGYPTPLLDWTYSPFVAAYFAFHGARDTSAASPRIYMFDQASWNDRYGRRSFIVDAAPPQLVLLESLPIGNPRSGPQQALSTVTNVADVEAFIRAREQEDGQSYLTVCDLPANDRPRIMRELELMGITYGSLFPGIEGACQDMKERLFELAV
jgi:FRG domain